MDPGANISPAKTFQLQTIRAWSGENYWNDDFIPYAGYYSRMPLLPTNMDTICWRKATIPRVPSNEHDKHTVRGSSARECRAEEQQVAPAVPLASAL